MYYIYNVYTYVYVAKNHTTNVSIQGFPHEVTFPRHQRLLQCCHWPRPGDLDVGEAVVEASGNATFKKLQCFQHDIYDIWLPSGKLT